MYKGGKKRHLAAASWVDERARAGVGAGEAMVMHGFESRLIIFEFFFFPPPT